MGEKVIIFILNKILTSDVIKGSEAELIAFLRGLADKSQHPIILHGLVDILAVALGVQ